MEEFQDHSFNNNLQTGDLKKQKSILKDTNTSTSSTKILSIVETKLKETVVPIKKKILLSDLKKKASDLNIDLSNLDKFTKKEERISISKVLNENGNLIKENSQSKRGSVNLNSNLTGFELEKEKKKKEKYSRNSLCAYSNDMNSKSMNTFENKGNIHNININLYSNQSQSQSISQTQMKDNQNKKNQQREAKEIKENRSSSQIINKKTSISSVSNRKNSSTTRKSSLIPMKKPQITQNTQNNDVYKKRTLNENRTFLKNTRFFDDSEKEKLEKYFFQVKVHTEIIENEYKKYKEKYIKYKSKYINLVNDIKKKESINIKSHNNLDHLALMLKGYCDFSLFDADLISNFFSKDEKNVLIDLFSQSNSNSYSGLIKKLVDVTYKVSNQKYEDMEISLNSESE